MREIHQSAYNPDELAWEVILEITSQLGAKGVEVSEERFEEDRALFDKISTDDIVAPELYEHLQWAKEAWESVGAQHGIVVYDDGEAGWTYVGSAEELQAVMGDEDN